MRRHTLLALFTLVLISACGGGSSNLAASGPTGSTGGGQTIASPAANVATLVVDSGPTGVSGGSVNVPFVSVTVCAPGTSICQTIDHIQVDTGSYGLRIISSVLEPNILSALPAELSGGSVLAECTIFGDGYSWGSVRNADVSISSEKASSLPIQVIGDTSVPNTPQACSDVGVTAENTVAAFGANGILGVGLFAQDCGQVCADNTTTTPQFYYACPTAGGACTATSVALTAQVTNPVSAYPTDNNGVIIQLPDVGQNGALTATGALVFGIDTQSNNALGHAAVLTTDANGFITVNYNNTTFPESFIDSGSNLIFINDNTIATCVPGGTAGSGGANSGNDTFFCPSMLMTLSATNVGANNTPSNVKFMIGNANTLFMNTSFSAFNNVAAPAFPGQSQSFDFGMPFFYGHSIFTAIEGKNTSGGMGPFFAY